MSQVSLILSLAKRSHALRGSAPGILVPVLPTNTNSVQLPCGTCHADAPIGFRCSCSIYSSAAAPLDAAGPQARTQRALRLCTFPAAAVLSTPSSPWSPLHGAPSLSLRHLSASSPAGWAASASGPSGRSGSSEDASGGPAGGGSSSPAGQPDAPSTGPVQNPLQAALAAAAAAAAGGGGAGSGSGVVEGATRAALDSRRAARRTWLWYDESDERQERDKERLRSRYGGVGSAHLLDVPQSMKKMDRIVRLVRGLRYDEAAAQCHLVPHKAAKYVLKALEEARRDAEEAQGLRADRLVVDTIYVTKGVYVKGMQPMGKGGTGRNTQRKSHLRVVLAESGAAPSLSARQVPTLMAQWTQPALGASLAGHQGHAAGPRRRFAYRIEV